VNDENVIASHIDGVNSSVVSTKKFEIRNV
jgi:hypothetical protein